MKHIEKRRGSDGDRHLIRCKIKGSIKRCYAEGQDLEMQGRIKRFTGAKVNVFAVKFIGICNANGQNSKCKDASKDLPAQK